MKFDLDTAWKDGTRLVKDNLSLMAIVAGVFFFLPYAGFMMAIPEFAQFTQMGAGQDDPDAMQAAILEFYSDYWWTLLLLAIVQGIGFLAMLALLRRRENPTVGEAIGVGARSVASYIAVQLLQALAMGVIVFLLVGLPIALGIPALALLTGIAGLVATLYLITKFSLSSPVIAMDGILNPIAAMQRSWRLTKGNSIRLFLFFVLIVVAFAIVSLIASMVFSLIFALAGEQVALFGTAVTSAATNALFVTLMAALLAAIHTQMTRLRSNGAETQGE